MNTIYDKFLSEHFLSEIEDKEFKLELSKMIFDTYSKRKEIGLSQKEMAKLLDMSLMSVRRIENGKCYDTRLISKYRI